MLIPFLIINPATNIAELASVWTMAGIGYTAIFASVIAFLFWSYGVSQLGPSRAGQFINLMPIFGAALAFTLLGESPVPSQFAGGALVLAGIALVERRPKPH
jgi:drug/metabolite transporter (DMT)-like permease